MARWKASLSEDQCARFVRDGFYPNYTHQRNRILFIGREAYGMTAAGVDSYIEELGRYYLSGEVWRGFHQKLWWVAWGILNRAPTWQDIPWIEEIADRFGKPDTDGGFSFAFMNANKCSNEGGKNTDWADMGNFLQCSMPYIREEVALLRPDIVIAMNLGEAFYVEGLKAEPLFQERDIAAYRLPDGAILLDTWHFSAPNKSPACHLYAPIVEALRELERW